MNMRFTKLRNGPAIILTRLMLMCALAMTIGSQISCRSIQAASIQVSPIRSQRGEAIQHSGMITINVDETKPLNSVSPRFDGVNFCALWNSTEDSPGTIRSFSQMGQKLVRFPGGVPCQWYDWQRPLESGWTHVTPEKAWNLASSSGAQMVFQTNSANDAAGEDKSTHSKYKFDSSGNHAAAWAEAANRRHIQVAFWEIGNEPEQDAPQTAKASQESIYNWYNAKFAEQAQAIKKVDPKAKIMGPAATNTWFWWHEHNIEKFLAAHGNRKGSGLADAVSVHWYPGGGDGTWEQKRGAAQGWKTCMDYLQGAIKAYDSRPLPLYITEWNYGGGMNNSSAGKLSNALGCADCIGMFRQTGVAGHTYFVLQHVEKGWGVLATKEEKTGENYASPTYYALSMASHMGPITLPVHSTANAENELSSYASTNSQGEIQVMLINKTAERKNISLKFQTFQPIGRKIFAYSLLGKNSSIDDSEVIYNGLASPKPAEQSLPAPRVIAWNSGYRPIIEPYSVTMYIFKP